MSLSLSSLPFPSFPFPSSCLLTCFKWIFVMADVSFPTIGTDFYIIFLHQLTPANFSYLTTQPVYTPMLKLRYLQFFTWFILLLILKICKKLFCNSSLDVGVLTVSFLNLLVLPVILLLQRNLQCILTPEMFKAVKAEFDHHMLQLNLFVLSTGLRHLCFIMY